MLASVNEPSPPTPAVADEREKVRVRKRKKRKAEGRPIRWGKAQWIVLGALALIALAILQIRF